MCGIKISGLPALMERAQRCQGFLKNLTVLQSPILHLLSDPLSADQTSEFKEADPGVSTVSSLISIIHQESIWSSEIKRDPTAKESKGMTQLQLRPFSSRETPTPSPSLLLLGHK